jgi:hypothetical protein
LVAKARRPATWDIFGASDAVISCCLRSRSSHRARRLKLMRFCTVGEPEITRERSISGTEPRISSICRA